MGYNLSIFKIKDITDLFEKIKHALELRARILPSDKKAKILIKLNLNSNLDSLTGNTTDLRVISAVVKSLTGMGYKNITLGDGNNDACYEAGVRVIKGNRIEKLSQYYNINVADFNYSKGREIELENGLKVQVADIWYDTDFIINIPKIKMHYRTMMSVCLKSYIGCLVGQNDKRHTHLNLIKNIIRLNKNLKSNLYIIDGLIGMEGNGPSAGTPVLLDTIIIGDNPYFLDLICGKIVGFTLEELPLLVEARKQALLTDDMITSANSLDITPYYKALKKPNPNPITRLVIHHKVEKYFIYIRERKIVKKFMKIPPIKLMLMKIGIVQEQVIPKERKRAVLKFDSELCQDCGRCRKYCPVLLNLTYDINDKAQMERCIDCLYCFAVCPSHAIATDSALGFYQEQLRRFDSVIRNVCR